MKVEMLRFSLPGIGEVMLQGIEMSTTEFSEMLQTLKELQDGEVKKVEIYSKRETTPLPTLKPSQPPSEPTELKPSS